MRAVSEEFHFDRTFYFARKKPWQFRSKMLQVRDNEVAETMRFGLAWRLHYEWRENKAELRHKGYGIQVAGRLVPLPLALLLGCGYAEEVALDDDSFAMLVNISHGW